MRTQQTDEMLADELESLEHDESFKRVRLLKEHGDETTELVERSGRSYVRKSFRLNSQPERFDELMSIYALLSRVSDPHLMHIEETYRIGDTFVVISEYVPGRTLRDSIGESGPLNTDMARCIMENLCDAVNALHTQACMPLIHRDITPTNIILTERGPKLIDYGILRRYDNEKLVDTRIMGTAGYAAPEQFGFGQTSPASDVYALGMVYYFMLTGEDPAPGIQGTILGDKRIAPADRAIIAHCVELNTAKRYQTVRELRKALMHAKKSSPIVAVSGFLMRHRKGVRRAVLIIASIAFWLIILFLFVASLTQRGPMTSGDHLATLIADWSFILLFVPGYLLICNPKDFVHRWRILRTHRVLKIVGFLVFWLVLIGVIITVATNTYSQEYVNYLAALHGSS